MNKNKKKQCFILIFGIPLWLLGMYLHEMGHIISAILLGSTFIKFEWVSGYIGWNLFISYPTPEAGYIIRICGGLVHTVYLLFVGKFYIRPVAYVGIFTFVYMMFETLLVYQLAKLLYPIIAIAFVVAIFVEFLKLEEI